MSKNWRPFIDIEDEFTAIQEKVQGVGEATVELQELLDSLKEYKKEIERLQKTEGILPYIGDEIAKGSSSLVKQEIVKALKVASKLVREDLPKIYQDNLISKIESTLVIKSLGYEGGKLRLDLLDDVVDCLGDVDTYFAAVEAVRTGNNLSDSQRMAGWINTFEAGGKDYTDIMISRLSLLEDTAPYWYFYEYGNAHFAGDSVLVPYPRYDAPYVFSKAEEASRVRIKQVISQVDRDERDFFVSLLKKISKLVTDIKTFIKNLADFPLEKLEQAIIEHVREFYKDSEKLEGNIKETTNFIYTKLRNGQYDKDLRISGLSKVSGGVMQRARMKKVLQKVGIDIMEL